MMRTGRWPSHVPKVIRSGALPGDRAERPPTRVLERPWARPWRHRISAGRPHPVSRDAMSDFRAGYRAVERSPGHPRSAVPGRSRQQARRPTPPDRRTGT